MRHPCEDDRNPRACAWHFSFHLSANMIDQITLVLGRPLGSAKILSYAFHVHSTECSVSELATRRVVLFWPASSGDAGSNPTCGRRGFDSLACSEGFPAIMLYSWPNNCPTIPFKIGFHRNPGRGFASSRPSLPHYCVSAYYMTIYMKFT